MAAKVPSIPLDALHSIQDQNVYVVLRAITDMLNVRNGQTGDSDSAFVTRAELGNFKGGNTALVGVPGAELSQGVTFPVIKPSDIARVINDLQAQVMESPLFKALGERIDRVDAPGTGVIARLDEEQTIRSTAVSSLVQQLTTLESTVGDQSVALQTESQTRADADGNIMGKYSVKVDANGYVSGFGLISTANNSTPFSDFTVRADRFSIGSPTGPGVPTRIPFIVVTTTQVVNGYLVPPGVYIDAAAIAVASIGEAQIQFAAIRRAHIQNAAIGTAQIEDASITNAKIGTAEIDTLKIRGDAVTVPRGSVNGSGTTPWPDTTICSISMPNGIPAVMVQATAVLTSDGQGRAYLLRNGTVVSDFYFGSQVEGAIVTPSLAYYDTSQTAATYQLVVGPSSGGGPVSWNGAVLTGLGIKR